MLYARQNQQPGGEQLLRLRFHSSPQIDPAPAGDHFYKKGICLLTMYVPLHLL
jgi:hypothetical protein